MTTTTSAGFVGRQGSVPAGETDPWPSPIPRGELSAEEEMIAVLNEKGGVAKTATVNGLAAASAARGEDFVVEDLDPRASATKELDVDTTDRLTIADILNSVDSKGEFIDPTGLAEQVIVRAGDAWPHVFCMPSERALANREADLSSGMEYRLREAHKGGFMRRFRRGGIDIAPRAGGRLSQVALAAATHVIIPMTLTEDGRDGAVEAVKTLRMVRASGLNPDIRLVGILPSIVEMKVYKDRAGKVLEVRPKTNMAKLIMGEIQEAYGDLVLPIIVPESVTREESRYASIPLTQHTSPTAVPVVQAYGRVLDLIHERRDGMKF